MPFTIKPNKQNMKWIKDHTANNAPNSAKAALNQQTTGTVSLTAEVKAKMKKRVLVHHSDK